MILVDTSVWIDFLQRGNAELGARLHGGEVLVHPFVVGELALGGLKQRDSILEALKELPCMTVADHDEVLGFIDAHALHGTGIGFVDAHLLASVVLAPGSTLWTLDRRLAAAATRLGVARSPVH